jgi:hypothetical protein
MSLCVFICDSANTAARRFEGIMKGERVGTECDSQTVLSGCEVAQ